MEAELQDNPERQDSCCKTTVNKHWWCCDITSWRVLESRVLGGLICGLASSWGWDYHLSRESSSRALWKLWSVGLGSPCVKERYWSGTLGSGWRSCSWVSSSVMPAERGEHNVGAGGSLLPILIVWNHTDLKTKTKPQNLQNEQKLLQLYGKIGLHLLKLDTNNFGDFFHHWGKIH